jgi:outer membrane receptor protein involved in Fe transport
VHLKQMIRTSGVVVLASLSSATVAQAESIIVGTVVDAATERPIPEAVVTATSPDLRGEQVVVTDAQGNYRIPALPPGIYTLRFDKEDFRPFSRKEIHLRQDRTIRVNVELLLDDDPGIICYASPPSIDVGSTTTGMEIGQEFAQHLAVNPPVGRGGAARSFESLAALAPGAQHDAYGVSLSGASSFENRFLVDGLSTQDPVFGGNAMPLNIELLGAPVPYSYLNADTVGVLTGGYMPEYGRAIGGIIRAHTRHGSNELRGSVFGSWAPGFLTGTPTPVSVTSSLSGQSALGNLGDFGATLGGPLVNKRLWFFAGVAPSLSRVEHTRTDGTSRTFFADQRSVQAVGKLTWVLNRDHNVSLSLITTPTRSGGAGRLTVDPLTGGVQEGVDSPPRVSGPGRLDSNFTMTALKYVGAFNDKKLLVDANLGWSRQTRSFLPLDGSGDARELGFDRFQANAQATYLLNFLGNHVLKAGADVEHVLAHVTSNARGTTSGGFVQDSWTLANHLTLNAGLRYDVQSLDSGDGRLALTLGDQLSPRIGLILDPTSYGRMKLFAHYAKYHGQVPLALMERASSLAGRYSVDSLLAPPASSELLAGAEYEVLNRTRLIATYTRRSLDSAIEDMSRDGSTFVLGNPGSDHLGDFPKAERTYDAVTVALRHPFDDGWLAEANYTWSRLHGNYTGLFGTGAGQGEPSILPEFDSISAMENRTGLLPSDRTHAVKVLGAKVLSLTHDLWASLGVSYRGQSGTPINYLGGNADTGEGGTFVLPRGSSGERTPWVSAIDTHVGVSYRVGKEQTVSFTLDVFNLFNSQQVTRVDENYTYATVLPLQGVKAEELTPDRVTRLDETTGEPRSLTESELNPSFKKPLQYQTPRQVRLGLRYVF